MPRFLDWATRCHPWNKEHGRTVGLWCRIMHSIETCCVWDASHQSPHGPLSMLCMKHLVIVIEPCLPWGLLSYSGFLVISSMKAPHRSCLPPVQGSPSQGETSPRCFERKEIVYITNVVMLLLPNFILKYRRMDSRLLWQSRISHALLLLILVPLPKKFHLCDTLPLPISYGTQPQCLLYLESSQVTVPQLSFVIKIKLPQGRLTSK